MYVCCCTENITTLSLRCRRGLWFGRLYYCMECEVHTTTSVNQNTLVACLRNRLACTSHPTQDSAKTVLVYFETVPVSTITNKTSYSHAQNRVKSVVTGLPDQSTIISAKHYIALTVTMR